MMVYVATIKFEGFDCFGNEFETDNVIGVFRTEENAQNALAREYELLELQGHTVTEMTTYHKFVEE